MTDLYRALEILRNNLESYTAKEIILELGWDNVSIKTVRRIVKNIEEFKIARIGMNDAVSKLANELNLLFYLNEHFGKTSYYSSQWLREMHVVNYELSDRQIRRYIKDINDHGFKIVTRRGISGGYRLENKLNF